MLFDVIRLRSASECVLVTTAAVYIFRKKNKNQTTKCHKIGTRVARFKRVRVFWVVSRQASERAFHT